MSFDYSLRDVGPSDTDWLWALNVDAYRDVIIRQFGRWDEDVQRDWFDRKWRQDRPAKIVMLADERVGVVVLERRGGHDWLDEILVGADYRGQGIGTALMKRFIAEAGERQRPLRLRVLLANTDAKRFYESLGFVALETLDHHYLMECDPSRAAAKTSVLE
ncbi:MAG: GNAT family N-acetyltransferase [Pseudomonadota bacterium]